MRKLFILPLALIVMFTASSLSFAQANKDPKIQKLADGIYSIFWGSYNSLVVVTNDGVVLTDPAYAFRANVLKKEIAKLSEKPVTKIILTHEHYDHVGGTEVFKDAEIICHRNCASVFDLDPAGRVPKKIDVTYDDEHIINYGGKKIVLKYFGRADGTAMSVIHLPNEKIVATADLYGPKFITPGKWMEDKNYLGARKILNWIAAQDLKHVVEAHHTNFDPAAVKENAEFVNDLFTAVNTAIQDAFKKGGVGAVIGLIDTLPKTLQLPKYSGWHGYKDHFPVHVRRMVLAIFHGG